MKHPALDKHVFISVKTIPNAPRNQIIGWKEGRLRVRIQGIPEKGRANQNLLEYLAGELGVAKTRLTICSGEKSRFKKIRIEGLTQEDLQRKWNYERQLPHE